MNLKGMPVKFKHGKRADLDNQYFRSAWEANIARYLNWLIAQKQLYKWTYEEDTFWFENIKRGTRSYTPDFKLWDRPDSRPYYWEIKGHMDQKSATRLTRMEKYFPDIKIIVVDQKQYEAISKIMKRVIKTWE